MLCSWQQRAEQEQYSRKSAAERRMEEAAAWEAEKAEAKQAKVGTLHCLRTRQNQTKSFRQSCSGYCGHVDEVTSIRVISTCRHSLTTPGMMTITRAMSGALRAPEAEDAASASCTAGEAAARHVADKDAVLDRCCGGGGGDSSVCGDCDCLEAADLSCGSDSRGRAGSSGRQQTTVNARLGMPYSFVYVL